MSNSIYLGGNVKSVYAGENIKEIYVGSKLVWGATPEDEFILDDFVLLCNGVTDSGPTVNDGSFGALQHDENGWVASGLTPYFARDNFSGNNGGVQFIYDSLKPVFNHGDSTEWTFDFWFYNTGVPANAYIVGAYNAPRSFCAFEVEKPSINEIGTSVQGSSRRDYCTSNKWHHVAIVKTAGSLSTRAGFFLDGSFIYGYDRTSVVPSDINTLRFRFEGAAGGIRISNIALRNRAVWTSNFEPPVKLYKQKDA